MKFWPQALPSHSSTEEFMQLGTNCQIFWPVQFIKQPKMLSVTKLGGFIFTTLLMLFNNEGLRVCTWYGGALLEQVSCAYPDTLVLGI